MSPGFKVPLHIVLLSMVILQGQGRYIEKNEIIEDTLGLLNSELKRELSEGYVYSRSLKCIDMLSVDGRFTFSADRPELHCATFFIGSPDEIISLEYNNVNIDCQGGDFLKVFDGWILKGEKFPSAIDHPLPTSERYIDFCDNNNIRTIIRSSQNVAMLFFRIHMPGNGFSLTIKKLINPFPCNVISQTPDGRFTMVIPHQKRNCSFSIIYPTEIMISELTLGHFNDLQLPIKSCGGATDFVQLLGGNRLDPSRMYPVADICYSFSGPAQIKIGCDNTVVRVVSSGKYINRLTFEYRQLGQHELDKQNENGVEDFCYAAD
ncbi:corticotropin-releasing factor-binding protein [Chiloscyllium plagiosum]|uniref:corticotropin-releasing factor-binding protein n=1 Tax=Chiloscyllium plagiosum TaxID=36176 RepID=UPI001CB85A10|nr:corticotropin-releasing factor-binding protein [Chiloscyllium plagiosum]